ncbi:YggS family pyridoxal phosphate-dependent enzyme [uncultured Butyricimonas sp.]|uniref:YggS family pyridoxal phosphate-dependent enzyme n=1 Tax=uncultured Butyricimonas sp. TaxID=1268785 RepID=UPI0026DAC132|nr:YggS family pyridoxal phosphate-dependent enzyme [uncultured Butyricimonas sp.]
MNSIAENLKRIADSLPEGVKLVAVSKTKPVEAIEEAYNAGQRVFGENRAQELAEKYEVLPKDIEWHLIGHLQTNKVKYVAGFVAMIHGVESLKLLETIDKEAKKHNRLIPCLLQFHVAKEETKFGLNMEEARELLESESYANMKNVRIEGVMGMATFTDDLVQVQEEFRHLKRIFDELKQLYFADKPEFKELSMGMSGDYKIAVEEGSTMVRVGSSIFGARQYKAIEN